ncbi:MAG: TIGR03905 family TSCPD domain-containing protein [Firmicutes bacterium]|nr:TIGR03905 family TSCPD domain-containing protein [Bacillota bacterium]
MNIESYRTTGGTCCKQIIYAINDKDELTTCKFINGCGGNTQGIARLVTGRKIDDIIVQLKGIPCKGNTSCPDQLAKALEDFKKRRFEAEEAEKAAKELAQAQEIANN